MKKILLILFFIFIFFLGFIPMRDPDFGWHYRCGNEVFTKHQLCTKNEFSYFLPDYQSYNSTFLYDIGLALLYNSFGFTGLSVANGLLYVICAILFYFILRKPLWLITIASVFFFFISDLVFGMGLRSQIVSVIFFLTTWYILLQSDHNKKYLYTLPVLFLIWVNTHIAFFLGPLLLTLYVGDQILKKNKIAWLPVILSYIVTLLNPFGFHIYQEIVNHANSNLGTMIAEWVPSPFQYNLLIIATVIFCFLFFYMKKKFSLLSILSLILFAYLAITARRNIPLFFASAIVTTLPELIWMIRFPDFDELFFSLLIAATFFTSIIQVPRVLQYNSSWNAYCTSLGNNFPCTALSKNPTIRGNIFASYEWGGFLIWQLPKSKVFVDGRMPAWKGESGISPYESFLKIIQTQPDWNTKLHRLKTDYILIYPDTFIDVALRPNPNIFDWKEVYRDKQAVLYKTIR